MTAGSYRIRLAKLLQRQFPMMRNTPVTWTPNRIFVCTGFWRINRTAMDVQSWHAMAVDSQGKFIADVGCWETIGECLKAGALELDSRGETCSPVLRDSVSGA